MPRLILTQEQADLVAGAREPIEVCDPRGTPLTSIAPLITEEEIAEIKRRKASPGPWFTGAQVQARLQALQAEWDRTGGFDSAHMREFLAQLDAADPGHFRPRSN